MTEEKQNLNVESFADNEVQEFTDTTVPGFLKFIYLVLPIWGLWTIWAFWNGSHGYLDRGYWEELQSASNTKTESVEMQDKLQD
jgi:hypothetical protein